MENTWKLFYIEALMTVVTCHRSSTATSSIWYNCAMKGLEHAIIVIVVSRIWLASHVLLLT